jgi:hypothetical protein
VAGFSARRSISQYRFSATELAPAFAAAGSPALIRRLGIVQVLEARKFLFISMARNFAEKRIGGSHRSAQNAAHSRIPSPSYYTDAACRTGHQTD